MTKTKQSKYILQIFSVFQLITILLFTVILYACNNESQSNRSIPDGDLSEKDSESDQDADLEHYEADSDDIDIDIDIDTERDNESDIEYETPNYTAWDWCPDSNSLIDFWP